MNLPKRLSSTAVALAIALTLPNLAMAGLKTGKGPVGVKLGATSSTILDSSMSAGGSGFAQTNWNSPTTATGGLAPGGGKSQDGVNTALGVYWSASAGIVTAGASGTGNGRLMASYLDSGGNPNTVPGDGSVVSGVALTGNPNNEPWLYITNLTAWLATNGACDYDVVLYVDGVTPGLISHYWIENVTGLGSSLTVGPNLTPPIYVRQRDLSAYLSSPSCSQATSSSYGSVGDGNYMVFPGLTADSILIRSEEDQPAVSNVVRSPISAVQLWPHASDPVVFNYTPASPVTNAAADVLRLVDAASGCGISAYQWMVAPLGGGSYTNVMDAGTISGASTVQLTISNLSAANQGQYMLVATNGTSPIFGSPIQVYVISTLFTNSLYDTTRYAGGTASFFASATGAGTMTYQWYKGSSAPYTLLNNGVQGNGSMVSGATNTTLAIGNLHTSDAGTYTVIATSWVGGSVVGQATCSAVLTVLPVTAGSYAESVVTNGAMAYWRLREPDVSQPAYDFVGGLNGVYGASCEIGVYIPGPQSAVAGDGYQGFESDNTCLLGGGWRGPVNNSWATVPALNLNTNRVTIVAWLFPADKQNGGAGILMTRHNGTTAGFGFSAGINGGATNWNELGCVWNNGAAANYHSGLCVSNELWSMVALVVSPTNLTFYCADTNSGIRSSSIAVNTINEAWAGPATIGYDDTMSLDRLLNGYIDEVAVFKRSLSASEIGRLWMAGAYNSVVRKPIITQQPKPTAVYGTRTAYFSAAAVSGGATTYRWQKVSGSGSPALLSDGSGVSGSATPNLTIANVQSSRQGDYRLVVTNSAGWSTSQVATLSVSNQVSAYETAVVSSGPVAYWRFNESLFSGYAYDCYGGRTAVYDGYALCGYPGPTTPDLPGMENANQAFFMRWPPGYDQSWVEVPPLNLNTNAVTIAAWIYPLGVQQIGAGLVYQRQGTTTAGLCYGNTTTLGYNWSNLSGAYGWNSGLTPPSNQWSFVTLVVQSNLATMYLLNTNGLQWATNILNHPVQAFAGVTQIGNDPYAVAPQPGVGASGPSRTFYGYIDEVAIWSGALSSNQVKAIYAGANPLYIAQQPASTNTYAGYTIQLASLAGGLSPFSYRWYSNNVVLPENGHFSGTTLSTLTINSAAFRDAADYTVVIGNSRGYITSQVARVTVKDPAYRIVWSATNAITLDVLTGQPGLVAGAATWLTAYSVITSNGPAVYTCNFTINGAVATATGHGATAGAFSGDTGNSDFNRVLNNYNFDAGPKTITLTNLIPSHYYAVYLFALNDQIAYGGRRAFFQDPDDLSNVSTTFTMSNNVYVVGTFTALTNTRTIIEQLPGYTNSSGVLTDVDYGNINAVIVRDLSPMTLFMRQPVGNSLYQGYPASPVYAISYSSSATTYQWQKNSGGGFDNIGSSGTMTNYAPIYLPSSAGTGDFRLVLNNSSGSYTSQVATVRVLPPPATGTYASAVLSYDPMAYWQFDETNGAPVAYDYAGGFTGIYRTSSNGQPGVPAPPFNGFSSTNRCFLVSSSVSNSGVTVPTFTRSASANLSIVAWVNLNSTALPYAGIVRNRGAGRTGGFTFGPSTAPGQLGFDWNNPTGGNGVTYNWVSGVTVPLQQWCLVALTISPTVATVYCIDPSGNVNTSSRVGPYDAEDWGGPLYIGADPLNVTWTTPGSVDEVAIFEHTLSYSDITNLYLFATLAPPAPPTGLSATPGNQQVSLSWNPNPTTDSFIVKRATNGGAFTRIATNNSSTTSFLDTNLSNGTTYLYVVSAMNPAGESPDSAPVSAQPVAPPVIATQPVSQSMRPGCDFILTVTATGATPFSYQWWKDNSPLAGQTNATLSLTNVQQTNFGTYCVVVANAGGPTTNSNATLALDNLPIAAPDLVQRFALGDLKLSTTDLLSNDSDPDGDPLTIISAGPASAAGGTVSLRDSWVFYTPPPCGTNSDTFTYTLSDGHCSGIALGAVTVQLMTDERQSGNFTLTLPGDGTVHLNFTGVPGWTYRIQHSDSLSPPDWKDLDTRMADAYGRFEYIDTPPGGTLSGFYRSVWP